MFDYISKEFNSISEMEKQKKLLISNLCNHFNLKRENFRLQRGSIILQGKCDNGKWINISSTITDFKTKLKIKNYETFRLKSYLVKK